MRKVTDAIAISWLEEVGVATAKTVYRDAAIQEPPLVCESILLVNRAFCGDTRHSKIWPVALDEPLPLCPVPLLPPDAAVPLSLGEVLCCPSCPSSRLGTCRQVLSPRQTPPR